MNVKLRMLFVLVLLLGLLAAVHAAMFPAMVVGASITLNVPDSEMTRVLNNFAEFHGYTGMAPGGGAETKAQFLSRKLREYVRESVAQNERRKAAEAASNGVQTVDVQ